MGVKLSYSLGIDLGTTYTAAAVANSDGRAEMFPLEHANPIIPSVVAVPAGEEPIVGSAAQRRAVTNPTAVAREFKRRFGDTTPIVLDGHPHGSHQLMAHLVRWIIGRATAEHGEPPAAVAITHPANWGPYKRELLHDVGTLAGLSGVVYVSEPAAAASWYASQAKLDLGLTVAVYDFGGGTFDAVVLRRDHRGFELAGPPAGLERLGGIDIDEMVVQFALQASGVDVAGLDTTDPAMLTAMTRLRDDARQAKEALSYDTSTNISVELEGVLQVPFTRAEFEDLARPTIEDTVTSLLDAVEQAGLEVDDLSAVLLVGGSSRIPLVAEIVNLETGLPVTVDTHSKNSVALGAALLAHRSIAEPAEPVTDLLAPQTTEPAQEILAEPDAPQEPQEPAEPVIDLLAQHVDESAQETVDEPAEPAYGVFAHPPPEPPEPLAPSVPTQRRPSPLVLVAGGAVLVAALIAGLLLTRDREPEQVSTAAPSSDIADDLNADESTTLPPETAAPTTATSNEPTAAAEDDVETTIEEPTAQAPGRSDTWITGDLADPARTRAWQSPGPTATPSEVWRSADSIGEGPVVVDGVLYASFQDQTIRAVDLATGDEIWSRETSFGARTPTITEDAVFFVDGFDVVAVDRETGMDELYRLAPVADIEPTSPSAPTVVDGRLYVVYSGLDDDGWVNKVVVVDLETGATLWRWGSTSGRALLPLVITDDAVAVVEEIEVLVVDRDTGVERWSHTLVEGSSPNEVLATGDTLILRDTRLRAFDLATGTERWSTPDSSLEYAATDGRVFTHSLDTRALDVATGGLLWSTRWDGPVITGTISVGDGVVYTHGSANGGLVALDAESGSVIWSIIDEEGFRPGLSHVLHDGYLVAVDSQQRIVVYR